MLGFVFPGQGAQYVGMGRDLYAHSERARDFFQCANDVLGFDLGAVCFDGGAEVLQQTRYAQPAIFAHSVLLLNLLEERGVRPDMVAGHSVGEYAALVAARVLSMTDALRVVHCRAQLMQKASTEIRGTMAAVIGLDDDQVTRICTEASSEGLVWGANFNAPGQVVISGEWEAVQRASALALSAGARRVIPLRVSGAFHCDLMASAQEELADVLYAVPMYPPVLPVVSNVTGMETSDPEEIRSLLTAQITHPVRWRASMERMIALGMGRMIEVGPGKVLQGLLRQIDRGVEMRGISEWCDLEAFVKREV